jgi:hypothetical protein
VDEFGANIDPYHVASAFGEWYQVFAFTAAQIKDCLSANVAQ